MSEELKQETVVEQNQEPETMASVMADETAPLVTMKRLLETGAHFGHQTRRWNPKMKKYIYGSRSGVYIIDLQKTVVKLEQAFDALTKIVEGGGKVLFVGTRKQYQDAVREEALRSGSFYITSRWLGGTLTNFRTIQTRVRYLKDLERQEEDGTLDSLPKKEAAVLRKEKDKLVKNLDGIKEMRRTPNAVFVIDPKIEYNAVKEARSLGIPVFGICDTNADPDEVDYVIPANDDAIRSVRFILALMADAVVKGKGSNQYSVAYLKEEDTGEEFTMDKADLSRVPVADKDQAPRRARKQMTEHSNKPMRRAPRPKVEGDVKKEEKVEAAE